MDNNFLPERMLYNNYYRHLSLFWNLTTMRKLSLTVCMLCAPVTSAFAANPIKKSKNLTAGAQQQNPHEHVEQTATGPSNRRSIDKDSPAFKRVDALAKID